MSAQTRVSLCLGTGFALCPTASDTGNRYVGGIDPLVHFTYVPTEGDGRGGAMRK